MPVRALLAEVRRWGEIMTVITLTTICRLDRLFRRWTHAWCVITLLDAAVAIRVMPMLLLLPRLEARLRLCLHSRHHAG
jgi:hypothetical protein